ncbi:MAG: ferredoxin--NADP(+) reductase [Candidatus Handelsmanbacteria bacterium RIFCSPLOWO2_12_FULL_64_10]|uniref:Ferredoxin--NADP reductase n=1 Tax=Handelsmanbacteria sp. (strain RIFCSPLOWO2_12_FULL_64_10) TaxID=1817868 RepID=A0A1F6D425_HANXR|nr:MAG: ferredoxin--NADP(+) reductase [Candidatus Handelsmanbacteria bacterium RIFCSPLOWO2_12_FULL_64_10]
MPGLEAQDVYDITIIGGGPVGLYGAYYSGMRSARTKIIDSLPQLGGQLAALYPEKYIYDVGGFPRVLAKDLVSNLEEQALQYDPAVCLNEKVVGLVSDNGIRTLVTDKGTRHFTRTVVIAAGIGAFVPRKLDIQDIDRLEGKGIWYFVRDVEVFRNKEVLIVGGGDSALDWALLLEKVAQKVTLVHRRDRFRAHEDSVARLLASSVDVRLFHELKAVHGDDRLEGVTIFENRTKTESTFKLDALLLNLGFLANLGPIKEWGLQIEGNAIWVNSTMQTNLPGVYAAGDIVDYPGKLKLISTGMGEIAIAVNYAKHEIDPDARVFPGHSSDIGGPLAKKT